MAEFFYMGGHGFYVWSSYLIVVIVFSYHYFAPLLKFARQVKELVTTLDPERKKN